MSGIFAASKGIAGFISLTIFSDKLPSQQKYPTFSESKCNLNNIGISQTLMEQ